MRLRLVPLVGLLIGLAIGCGKTEEGPARAPVAGVVKYKDKPLDHGRMVFIEEKTGHGAYGFIQLDGSYRVPDAAVGMNHVLVQNHALECGCPDCVAERDEKKSAEAKAAGKAPEKSTPLRSSEMVLPTPGFLPKKYETYRESGLTVNVKAGTDNAASFDLKE